MEYEHAKQEVSNLRQEKQSRELRESAVDSMSKMHLQQKIREQTREIDALKSAHLQAEEKVASLELEAEQLQAAFSDAMDEKRRLLAQAAQQQSQTFARPAPKPAVVVEEIQSQAVSPKKFAVRPPLTNFNQTSILPGAKAVAQPAPLSLACETPTTRLDQKWKSSTPMHAEDQTESNEGECKAQ